MAACVLHNMLREEVGFTSKLCDQEDPATCSVTNWSGSEDPLLGKATMPTGTNTTHCAKSREYLVSYLNSEVGAVPRQLDMI